MVKTRKDLEFFKVFLPEFSTHELVIPPSFIDIIEKPLPNKALLLDEIGRKWSVETRTEDTEERFRVLFKKGWDVFAEDQSLEFGDFLVFSYDGDSRFSVTIFAKDGCRKDLAVDRSRVSIEKETVVKPVDVCSKPERRRDCGKRVTLNRKFVSVKEEPSFLVHDGPENVSVIETEPEHRVDNSRSKVNRERDPCGMSWVPEKRHKGFKEPVSIKPDNPHFVRNITQGSLRKLEIPSTFLKSNGIEMEEDIELCDEKGKRWPLKIVNDEHRGHHRGLIFSHDSWLCFCERHKLRKPHKCLFEFIVRSNGRCKEIRVCIFRGKLLTSVTKSGYQVVAM